MHRLYRNRLLSVASFFVLIGGVVAGVILLPSYLIVKRNQTSLGSNTSSNRAVASVADRALIKRIQSRVNVLSPYVGATSTPSSLMQMVLASRPSGVSVNRITFTGGGKTFTIILSGTSVSADKIGIYQTSLAKNKRLSGISVPIGSLAGTNDGRFNITISGAL